MTHPPSAPYYFLKRIAEEKLMRKSQKSIPQHLKIRVGGILGPVYSIRIKGNDLLYRVHEDENNDDYSETAINPADEDWQAFKKALDDIGVWHWQEEYPNTGHTDGTQWFLEIEWDDRKIKSFGDNNFPIADGDPENDSDISPTFESFLGAVRKLIGGLKFR